MRAAIGPAGHEQALVGPVHREDGEDIADPIDHRDGGGEALCTRFGYGLGDDLADIGGRERQLGGRLIEAGWGGGWGGGGGGGGECPPAPPRGGRGRGRGGQ